MSLDVIIPAYNAAATIADVLAALRPQLRSGDHVLVVDDGSTDETAARVRAATHSDTHFTLRTIPHGGPAAARNAGMRAATADILLFLGADCVPARDCLRRHRTVHHRYLEETIGCVGFVTWDPLLEPTPFMVWLEHGGNQNAFGEIAGTSWVDPRAFTYGANLSLKRSLVSRLGGFDAARFPGYGFEDLELGFRLQRLGFRLWYEPTARAWHVHRKTVAAVLHCQRDLAAGFRALRDSVPELQRRSARTTPVGRIILRRLGHSPPLLGALKTVATWLERRFLVPRLYTTLLSLAFTKCVQDSPERTDTVENIGGRSAGIPRVSRSDILA